MTAAIALLCVLAAYLLGGIPTGAIVARARGVDLRRVGSGNIGASNAARALGVRWGLVVLAGDAGKGAAAVAIAAAAGLGAHGRAAAALAAVLGHVLPPALRFRGGKGVATALGACLAIVPGAALAGAAVWIVAVALTRISAVGSLLGVATAAAVTWARAPGTPEAYLTAALLALVIATHRDNLARLARGRENRL